MLIKKINLIIKIFFKIQNEIKDKIINKYLDKINNLDTLCNQIFENEIFKK